MVNKWIFSFFLAIQYWASYYYLPSNHAEDIKEWIPRIQRILATHLRWTRIETRLISTFQNKTEQAEKSALSRWHIRKVELTTAERTAIKVKVKQQLQENKKDPVCKQVWCRHRPRPPLIIRISLFTKQRETYEFKGIPALNDISKSFISNDQEDKILIWKLTLHSILRYAVC